MPAITLDHATDPADHQGGPQQDDMLTPGEVSAIMRVHPKTVTRWAKAGKIASLRTPGGHRRYRRGDLPTMGFES